MVIGLGTRLISVDEFRCELEPRGEAGLEELFERAERESLGERTLPWPSLAARAAAKHAALDALGRPDGATMLDVTIVRGASGPPALQFHGAAARAATARGVRDTHVSLTHERDHALAVVVLGDGQ